MPLVVVTDPPLPYPTGVEEKLTRIRLDQAQDYLDDMVEQLRGQGQAATGVAVTATDVPGTLLQLGRPPRVGLLAIATHGRGGVSRMFLGSVTDKLVRGADLPVLVCRPPRSRQVAREDRSCGKCANRGQHAPRRAGAPPVDSTAQAAASSRAATAPITVTTGASSPSRSAASAMVARVARVTRCSGVVAD